MGTILTSDITRRIIGGFICGAAILLFMASPDTQDGVIAHARAVVVAIG